MREVNAHLTLEEILLVLRPEDRGADGHSFQVVRSHLVQCADCARALDRYKGVMAKLNLFSRASQSTVNHECPRPDIWIQVAAGVLSDDEALGHLEHAALCSSCSIQLREAVEIVGASAPPEFKLQQALQTSKPSRQKSLAGEMAARSRQVLQSEAPVTISTKSPIPFASKPSRRFRLSVWAYGAVAAILVAGVALAAFMGLFRGGESGSTERFLAQAYAQQRTVELRIPGAGYGPVRVERGQKQSQMSSPGALLEAETAIKKGLEQHPDDPNILRQKAEADLLNWDYQPAIETLGHAMRIGPQSSKVLVDLATAHFERAEATDTPADYESALQYLGDALRLSPKDAAALFNRAIIYERLFLYSSAIADWELLLTIEGDAGWKEEAQKRLNDLKARQQRHSARDAPSHLDPAAFKTAVENKTTLDPEQYIELAERKILPNISQANQQDENYQLAVLLAQHFESVHSDRFFTDLLRSAGEPGFHEAARLLGKASEDNGAGLYESAYAEAAQSIQGFQQIGSSAGVWAAKFEQVYALQLESLPIACETKAAELLSGAVEGGYAWLRIQTLIEQATCFNIQGELGVAKSLTKAALSIAKEKDYPSYYLRGLTMLAALESESGNESSAWSAIQEGLKRFWSGNSPDTRAYGFYNRLDQEAERMGHWNVQLAAAQEAVGFASGSPNRVLEAIERSRLADAALRVGNIGVAQQEFSISARLFSSIPQTPSVLWRKLEAKLGVARAQSLQGGQPHDQVFTSLLGDMADVKQLSNRYVEFLYYTTLAQLKMQSADWQAAEQFLGIAIHLADNGLYSLSTSQERFTWMGQHRQTYLLMAELLFRSGRQKAALDLWERFLSAQTRLPANKTFARLIRTTSITRGPNALPGESTPSPTMILTYAFTADGVIIWARDGRQTRSIFISVPPREFKRTAEDFMEECSRPDSSLENLRANARLLYAWLVHPVESWLPSSGHLLIEPDQAIGVLPLEALVGPSGAYVGERYSITLAPGLVADPGPAQLSLINSPDHALVVAAPAANNGSLGPPPGALSEAEEIARLFSGPTVFLGAKARVAMIKKEIAKNSVFHFAGHATLTRSGAAMLLADGSLGITGPDQENLLGPSSQGNVLRNMKLAVFSACGTARPGEVSPSNSLVVEFLQSGAQHVVASRWNVDSVITTDFMGLFYSSLLSGHTVASALHSASRTLYNMPGKAHPYYWAAFSSFGRT